MTCSGQCSMTEIRVKARSHCRPLLPAFVPAHGFMTSLMQPSFLSRKVLWSSGLCSSEARWVIANEGSISPQVRGGRATPILRRSPMSVQPRARATRTSAAATRSPQARAATAEHQLVRLQACWVGVLRLRRSAMNWSNSSLSLAMRSRRRNSRNSRCSSSSRCSVSVR
jgi:hypothetical protein